MRGGGEGANQEKHRLTTLCRQMEAPQRVGLDLLLPKQQRRASSCSQHLLGGPQCVSDAFGFGQKQVSRWHPPIAKCNAIRNVRRLKKYDWPLDGLREHRLQ